jgi:cytochrome c oxidase accessory protein FixG
MEPGIDLKDLYQDEEGSFRDRVSTVDEKGKRVWIYAQQQNGRYYTYRTWLSLFFVALLISMPFIKINGQPFILLNILERKFIIFGQIFWPQDFFLFGFAMLTAIVFIIVFTVIYGRIFCGWVCPQTIFMEMIFRRIEYWIEGTASQQRLLNQAPWSPKKIRIKLSKWIVFYGISFIVGNIFLSYIIGVDALWEIISSPPSQHVGGLTAMVVFSGVFFFVFTWFREQVCTVVCPYGRLQGVLLDRNSIVVAYDYIRGEPRGKISKKADLKGDCIDCNLCVKVCPTGIDIRNGTQLDCVNCTACIDACDSIMDKIERPRGLIRYASEANIADNKPFEWTGRIKAYSFLMLLLLGVFGALLFSRKDIQTTVIRVPGQLFQELDDNRISNLYNIKLVNKTFVDKNLTLKGEGQDVTIQLIGREDLEVMGEDELQATFFLILNKDDLTSRKTKVKLGLYEGDRRISTINTNFLGPLK